MTKREIKLRILIIILLFCFLIASEMTFLRTIPLNSDSTDITVVASTITWAILVSFATIGCCAAANWLGDVMFGKRY